MFSETSRLSVAQVPLDWFLRFRQIFNLVSEHFGELFHSVCGSLVSVFLSLDVKPDESLMLRGKKLLLSLKIFLHDSCCTFGLAVLLSEADLINFSSELISPAFSPVCLTELAANSGLSFSLVWPCVSELLGGGEDTGEVFRAAGKSVWNSGGATISVPETARHFLSGSAMSHHRKRLIGQKRRRLSHTSAN